MGRGFVGCGFNRDIQAYTGELDGAQVDASVLLMSSVGYKKADDPRVKSTYALICQRLGQDGLLQRYESGVDGLTGDEGSFGICSFWALEQVAQRGELEEAESNGQNDDQRQRAVGKVLGRMKAREGLEKTAVPRRRVRHPRVAQRQRENGAKGGPKN